MVDQTAKAVGESTNKDLQAVHNNMLEGLGQLSDYFGFSKVMGQLYGAVLLSPEPLCLDDLMERLEISKASVSMNMRTLEHLGMVRQVWVRGGNGRRKYYEAETDFWTIISNVISSRELRDLDRALTIMQDDTDLLSAGMATMRSDEQEIAKLYMDRIARIKALFQFAQLMITTILTRANSMDLDGVSHIDIG